MNKKQSERPFKVWFLDCESSKFLLYRLLYLTFVYELLELFSKKMFFAYSSVSCTNLFPIYTNKSIHINACLQTYIYINQTKLTQNCSQLFHRRIQ